MGNERRRAPRAKVNLAARWEGASTLEEARVTNLSETGCFVLSGGTVEIRELIRLEITFPDDSEIYPWAEVIDEANEIGFAVRFNSMDDEELERLRKFVQQALVN
ncbi:MAG TPA: PilZ domain-containing protein [Pyrinomonadaceae bacterium]|nr:PilZ domain-containing protein [Pyrinomonadaceae bacterium]